MMDEWDDLRKRAGIEKKLTENVDFAAMENWARLMNTKEFLKKVWHSEGVMQRGGHSQETYNGLAMLLEEMANILTESATRVRKWSPKNQAKRLGK